MNLFVTRKHNNVDVNIYFDTDATNPLDIENGFKLISFDKKQNYGHKHNYNTSYELFYDLLNQVGINESLNKLTHKQLMNILKSHYYIKPVYILDHSGVKLSLNPFNDKFDSGLLGYCYITKEEAKSLFKTSTMTLTKEIMSNYINEFIQDYNYYINGECYIFSIDYKGYQDSLSYIGNLEEEYNRFIENEFNSLLESIKGSIPKKEILYNILFLTRKFNQDQYIYYVDLLDQNFNYLGKLDNFEIFPNEINFKTYLNSLDILYSNIKVIALQNGYIIKILKLEEI